MSVLTKRQRYSPSNDSESIQSSESSIRSNTSCENPVRHLFLIRHGQYERERTQNDGHLTTSGEKQAWYAADFLLSQLPENVLFDSLTHSDMIRTRETARIIYQHLQSMKKINIEYYSIDTDFREHNLLIQFLFEGNWRALKRDYFRLKKSFLRNDQTTFEIIITHRNIIGHCIELLTMIQPDKSIAFNASVTHVIVDRKNVVIDYAYKHDFLPIELLTMWEVYLPMGHVRIQDKNYVHTYVNGVKGAARKGCCIRVFISCLR